MCAILDTAHNINENCKVKCDIPHEQRRTENEKTCSISARIA